MTVKPLQSNSNVISALTGGTLDAGVLPGTPACRSYKRATSGCIGWVGDLAPGWTGSAAFTGTKTANTKGDLVKRFLNRLPQGNEGLSRRLHRRPADKRADGPTAPAMLALLSNYTGVAAADIDRATPYIDASGRIDAADIARQIAWYKSQGLLKGEVKAEELIDTRYAMPVTAGK